MGVELCESIIEIMDLYLYHFQTFTKSLIYKSSYFFSSPPKKLIQ